MNLLRFIKVALITNLRLSVIFRISFILDMIVTVIKQGLFLAAWNFFFAKYGSVNGWNFQELLLACGLLSIGVGIVEIFFYGLKNLPQMIESNMLDSYIIQPQNLILNIALSKGKISSVGDLVTGIIAIIYSKYLLLHWFNVILLIPLAIMFFIALYLYLGSIGFFIKNSSGLIEELYRNTMIIATQPNIAYSGLLKFLILTILPVGFIGLFPISFIKNSDFIYLLISYSGTLTFFAVACAVFYRGVRKYESGNIFVTKY